MPKTRLLFICTGSRDRSPTAEDLLRYSKDYEAKSAGTLCSAPSDPGLAVTSVNSLLCHTSTCFRIGSKVRCIRSTPIDSASSSEKCFECFARTGLNTPVAMYPNFG